MRLNKTNLYSPGQWLSAVIILSALILSLLTAGCSEQLDAEDECLQDLDNKNFSSVADNPACSVYERASAHMGLAGFLFANFIRKNASDNFRESLGIPGWEKTWENTPRQRHYQEARRLTGDSTNDHYYLRARPTADTELHLFASLASIISESYIKFDDITPDGKITEEEINSFTQMVPESDISLDITVDLVLLEKGPDAIFLIEMKDDISGAKCRRYDSTYDYAGMFPKDGTTDFKQCGVVTQTEIDDATTGSKTVDITGDCAVIAKVNELQFFEGNSSEKVQRITNIGGNFFKIINGVNKDLDVLDISSDSELRKNLDSFTKDIDNGGQCATGAKKTLDRALAVVGKAAREPQVSYKDASIDFNDLTNDVNKADIIVSWKTQFEAGGVALTFNFNCDNPNNLKARLIFARSDNSADGYVPYYGDCDETSDPKYCCDGGKCGAKPAVRNSLITLSDITKNMETDSSADDGKLSISELVCFDNTSDSQ